MKIYISTQFERSGEIRELSRIFAKKGHEPVNNWIDHIPIKPYAENSKTAKEYAIEDILDALNCDAFILLCGERKGDGMHVELGAAIASAIKTGRPKIYIVGKTNDSNLFYFHPAVKRVDSIEEVLKEIS
jgi:hypothetical protein